MVLNWFWMIWELGAVVRLLLVILTSCSNDRQIAPATISPGLAELNTKPSWQNKDQDGQWSSNKILYEIYVIFAFTGNIKSLNYDTIKVH